MPLRKAHRHYALEVATYDQDDVPINESMASMKVRIDMLAAQMAELFVDRHCILECEDKLSENFANPFSMCRHRIESTDH